MENNSNHNESERPGSDSPKNPPDNRPQDGRPQPSRRGNNSLLIFLVLAAVLALLFYQSDAPRSLIKVSDFQAELEKGNIAEVSIGDRYVYGDFKIPPELPASTEETAKPKEGESAEPKKLLKEFRFVRSNDSGWVVNFEKQLKAKGIPYSHQPPDDTLQMLSLVAMIGLPLAILFLLFMMFRRTRSDLMGGGFLSGFSKSPAKRFEANEKIRNFR